MEGTVVGADVRRPIDRVRKNLVRPGATSVVLAENESPVPQTGQRQAAIVGDGFRCTFFPIVVRPRAAPRSPPSLALRTKWLASR